MIVKKHSKAREAGPSDRDPFWVKDLERRGLPMGERILAIFQPDVLIEPQYQATYRRRYYLGPEHALMLAVLEDAVTCFQEHVSATCKRKQVMHRDAEDWILSRDRSYLFSFENVCEALGHDADYMRQGLLRWKEKSLGLRRKRSQPQKSWPAKSTADMAFEPFAVSQGRK